MQSIYHQKFGIKHGEEKQPTLYLLKKKEKPYHIDYCFSSKSLFTKKTTFEIGKYEDWIEFSDHMPIIIDNLNVQNLQNITNKMKTTTFITFVGNQCGKAEEAINYYTSLFPNSEIKSILKYTEGCLLYTSPSPRD